MPIEIKQLIVKVKVEEQADSGNSQYSMNSESMNQLKNEMIRKCTNEVIEKLKEREQR